MTQKDLSAKVPSTITFDLRGRQGRGTLTYAARNQQYVIVETGKPEDPIYLRDEELEHVTENGSGLALELPEAARTGTEPGGSKNPERS